MHNVADVMLYHPMHYGLSLHGLPPGVMAYCQTAVRIESELGEKSWQDTCELGPRSEKIPWISRKSSGVRSINSM